MDNSLNSKSESVTLPHSFSASPWIVARTEGYKDVLRNIFPNASSFRQKRLATSHKEYERPILEVSDEKGQNVATLLVLEKSAGHLSVDMQNIPKNLALDILSIQFASNSYFSASEGMNSVRDVSHMMIKRFLHDLRKSTNLTSSLVSTCISGKKRGIVIRPGWAIQEKTKVNVTHVIYALASTGMGYIIPVEHLQKVLEVELPKWVDAHTANVPKNPIIVSDSRRGKVQVISRVVVSPKYLLKHVPSIQAITFPPYLRDIPQRGSITEVQREERD